MKKLRVTVDGKPYEVLVEMLDGEPMNGSPPPVSSVASAQVAAPVVKAPAAPASQPADGPGLVLSPLAGKVVSVQVKVGDTVTSGAQVATLEAMKMNTYINAPKAGRVEAILASPGDAVNEGTALMRIT